MCWLCWALGVVTPTTHENLLCQFNTISDIWSKRRCLPSNSANINITCISNTRGMPSPCRAFEGWTERMTPQSVRWDMDMKSGSSVKSAAWNIKHWLTALAAAHHITSHHPTHQQITTEQVSSGFFSSSFTSDQVKDHGAHLTCISFACREATSGMLIKLSIIDYNRWSLEGSWQNTRKWFDAIIKPETINRMAQYATSMHIIYHHIISIYVNYQTHLGVIR